MKTRILLYFLPVILLLFFVRHSASSKVVYGAKGAGSDVINGLIVTTDGKLFAGTDNGLFVSADDGFNWVKDMSPLADAKITALKYHNNKIYAASSIGLYVSLDIGQTWQLLNADISVRSMAFTPSDYIFIDGFNQYNDLTIQISVDNGKTWMESYDKPSDVKIQNNPRGDIFRKGEYYLYRLVYSGSNYCWQSYCWQACTNGYSGGARCMLIVSDDYMLSSTDKGLFYSIYRGDGWGKLSNASFGTLGADNYGRLFGDNKISLDSGKTWHSYFTDTSFTDINLILSPKKGFVYYASDSHGIKFTTDDGKTWFTAKHSLNELSFNDCRFFGTVLYVATDNGMYYSTDKTLSWYPLNNGFNDSIRIISFERKNNGDLLAWSFKGGFWSYSFTDGKWTKNKSQITYDVRKLVHANNGYLIAATSNGVYYTADDGGSWYPANTNLSDNNITSIYQGVNDSIFIGTALGNLYKSYKSTLIWEPINGGAPLNHPVTSISQNTRGDIFVSTIGGGVYRCKALTDNFIESNLQSEAYDITSVFAPKDDYVVAGWKYGYFTYSSSNGDRWRPIGINNPDPNNEKEAKNILMDNDSSIYIPFRKWGFIIIKGFNELQSYLTYFYNMNYVNQEIHSDIINQIRFSKLDSTFFTCASDGLLRIWRMEQNDYYKTGIFWIKKELKFDLPVTSFDLSSDGKNIAVGTCRNDSIASFVYDLVNERYLASFNPVINHLDSNRSYSNNLVKYSGDGNHIINSAKYIYNRPGASFTTGDLTLWNAKTFSIEKNLKTDFCGGVSSIAVASSGSKIAIAYDSSFRIVYPNTDPVCTSGVALLDLTTADLTKLTESTIQCEKNSNVVIARDNSIVTARCSDTLYVGDFNSGNLLNKIYNKYFDFNKIGLSDNNIYLAGVQNKKNEFQIWALNSQRYYDNFGINNVSSFDLAPDSQTFLFACGKIAFWYAIPAVTPVEEKQSSSQIIYPNPANNFIVLIDETNRYSSESIKIFNVFGQEEHPPTPSYEEWGVRIDVSGLPPGVYFVRVGNKVSKFLRY